MSLNICKFAQFVLNQKIQDALNEIDEDDENAMEDIEDFQNSSKFITRPNRANRKALKNNVYNVNDRTVSQILEKSEVWVTKLKDLLRKYGKIENRKLFHIQSMLEKLAFPHKLDVRAAGFRNLEEALKSLDFIEIVCDGPQSRLGRMVKRLKLVEKSEENDKK